MRDRPSLVGVLCEPSALAWWRRLSVWPAGRRGNCCELPAIKYSKRSTSAGSHRCTVNNEQQTSPKPLPSTTKFRFASSCGFPGNPTVCSEETNCVQLYPPLHLHFAFITISRMAQNGNPTRPLGIDRELAYPGMACSAGQSWDFVCTGLRFTYQ